MSRKSSSGSNGSGPHKPLDPDIKSMLQQYLETIEATDPAAEETDVHSLSYQGKNLSPTGVVRLMRENGNHDSADLMEELHQTQESALRLLNQLRVLHKRRTGAYPRLTRQKSTDQ